jgi:hypothetical protein
MTPDPYFNRPSRCPIPLHKRKADPRDNLAEAFYFGLRHSEVERLIL